MAWLRQLMRDAQHVLREMSMVQRVTVSLFVATVAIMLTFAVWIGSRHTAPGRIPLAGKVAPAEYQEVVNSLRGAGIDAEYEMDLQQVTVPMEQSKKAMLHMVSNNLVKDPHAYGMEEMLKSWSFTDPRSKTDQMTLLARGNAVAGVIQAIDSIKEASVIYNDKAQASLFVGAYPVTAMVKVTTKLGRDLSDEQAQGIIKMVAAAKAGLDPRGVIVVDQHGNQYEAYDEKSPGVLGRRKFKIELELNESLRRDLETVVARFTGPNIAHGGAILVRPHHEVNADYIEEAERIILEGQATTIEQEKRESRSTDKPAAEPGAKPNVISNRQMSDNMMFGNRITESSQSEKRSRKLITPGTRERMIKYTTAVKDLMLSVVINLPYELERNDQGRLIPELSDDGRTLLDPEHGGVYWKRKSAPRYADDRIRSLGRALARASGIKDEDIPEKIHIDQVEWQAPVMPILPPESELSQFLAKAPDYGLRAFMGALILGAVAFVWREARSKAVKVEEEIDEEEFSVALAPALPEDDGRDAEMEATRMRVQEAVLEDPQRAAALVRRWMNREK